MIASTSDLRPCRLILIINPVHDLVAHPPELLVEPVHLCIDQAQLGVDVRTFFALLGLDQPFDVRDHAVDRVGNAVFKSLRRSLFAGLSRCRFSGLGIGTIGFQPEQPRRVGRLYNFN